jgi:thiol-disulfide isomerase/thioredoxin
MRSPVLIGALMALAVGVLAIGGLVALASQPPITPAPTSPPPGSSLGLYTPSPSPSASASPTTSGGPSAQIGPQVGMIAPRIVLPHIAGGSLDTGTVTEAGTPLWINFMATWCPPCRDELPMMERIDLDLGDDPETEADLLEVVLVDVGEDEETVLQFLISIGVDLPTALDRDGAVQREWGALILPVHFFVDADGVVQEVVFGGAPEEVFLEAVRKIVPEADIEGEP